MQITTSLALTRQEPVLVRERLGSVPKDAYIEDRAFLPNIASTPEPLPGDKLEFSDGIPAYADNPIMEQGVLSTRTVTETVNAKPYSPLGHGLTAAAGSVLGSVLASAIKGGPVSLIGAGACAIAFLGAGSWNAGSDTLSVVETSKPVYHHKLVGYQERTLDGAFVPDRPRNWPDTTGQLHYYTPEVERSEVGRVTAQEISHSAVSQGAVAGASFLGGLATGLLIG